MKNSQELIRGVIHGCVCLAGSKVVYVDPYMLPDAPHDADVIIITHAHGDHASPKDIAKVVKADTMFVTTAPVVAQLPEKNVMVVSHASAAVQPAEGVFVQPVVAQNKNHDIDIGMGVVVSLNGSTFYISGDTDVLAKDVVCDVLFVCCDGSYNMSAGLDAVVQEIQAMHTAPRCVMPYHDGKAFGAAGNAAPLVQKLRLAGLCAEEPPCMRKQ